MTTEDRIKALASHLGCEVSEIVIESEGDTRHEFSGPGGEYLVLTEDEADKMVAERILEDVWAFNAEFLVDHMSLNDYDRADTVKSIKAVQEKCCEGCNGLLRAALKAEGEFVGAAVDADGRGHFLSGYDGEENEEQVGETWLYLYRTN